ncbi:hypothetical protein FOCC_FOCC003165 [Frankliniella occidentalis]|nr:hypothetical protein FOCC_FOCC003165 [Frankliniella occidentalis]
MERCAHPLAVCQAAEKHTAHLEGKETIKQEPLEVVSYLSRHKLYKAGPSGKKTTIDRCAGDVGTELLVALEQDTQEDVLRVGIVVLAPGTGRWVVLFSHPADFTPVYTTELGRIDRPLPRVPEAQHQAAGSLVRQALYIIGPDHKLKLAMLHPMSTGRNVEEQGPMRCIDSLRLSSRLPYVAKPANWTPGDKVMFLPEVPEVKESDLKRLFPRGVERVSMPSGIGYVSTTTDNGYKNTSKL